MLRRYWWAVVFAAVALYLLRRRSSATSSTPSLAKQYQTVGWNEAPEPMFKSPFSVSFPLNLRPLASS